MRYFTAVPGLIVLSLTAIVAAQTPGDKTPGGKTAEEPVATPFLGTATTRTLLVRVPRERLPLNFIEINQLLMSREVAGLAVTDVSGKPFKTDQASQQTAVVTSKLSGRLTTWSDGESNYTVECLGFNSRSEQLELMVRYRVEAARTDTQVAKFIEAVARRLGEALTQVANKAHRDSIAKNRRAVERERAMAEAAEEKVRRLRSELRSVAPVDATQAILTENIGQLQRQKQSLEIDLAGMKGRAVAIQDHVKELTERLQREPENDEVVKNLERVVKLRATQLERITDLRIYRVIDEAAKAKAEEQLILAQVELDRARRESRKSTSDQLDKLNTDLAGIAISTAEMDAKLKYVQEKLADTRKQLEFDVHQAQPLRDRLTVETAAYQLALAEAQKREAEMARLDANVQPVTVELGPDEPTRKRAPRN
jgi:hypothetical protein